MSSIFLQIGQCGNQIGHSFWGNIAKLQCDDLVFREGGGSVRSIHIDTEPKVVKQLHNEFVNNPNIKLREKNLIVGKRGRGTNWALGYNGTKNNREDSILEDSMEAIRKEIERCDSFSGTILMHSISGGTGSGLGSKLTECIREEYPMNYMLNCVVAPHMSGESPLQHYNSLLCLNTLQNNSDAIMLFHNDEVLERLEAANLEHGVSFKNMNKHIANCLCGVFLPTDTLKSSSGGSIGLEPWEMLRSVCPMPSTKFLHCNHLARSKMSWEGLCGVTLQKLKKRNRENQAFSSLATLVIARGDSGLSFQDSFKKVENKVKSVYNCVSWNPFPVDYWQAKDSISSNKDLSSLTMVSNYSNIIDYTDIVVQRAMEKFEAGAYLHWYYKYGCCEDDFESAFETLSNISNDYRDAIR